MHHLNIRWITGLLLSVVCLAGEAQAKQAFGPQVDAFCSSSAGSTPYADLANGMLGECTLCHGSVFPTSFPDKGNVIPQAGSDWKQGKSSGDFSAFCPLANNSPPVLSPIGAQAATQGMLLTLLVSATDPDGNGIALAVANAPAGHSFADNGDGTGTFTWTPASGQLGSFSVTFSATDDGVPMMTAMEVVTISVGQSNQPPVLTPIADRSLPLGVAASIAVTASDPDGDSIVLNVAPLPAGAIFTDNGDGTGNLDWTPSVAGNFALTATATDDGVPSASATEGFVLTAGNVNRPPTLTPIGNRSTDVGTTLQVLLTASDPDMDGLGYAFMGLPPTATFSDFGDGTAEILWTPGAAGRFFVTAIVSDDGSPIESTSETFELAATDPVVVGNLILDDAWWSFGADDSDEDSDSDDSDDSDSDDSDDSDSDSDRPSSTTRGSLTVTGHGADPQQPIAVFDATSSAVLGYGWADGSGDFRIVLMPFLAPCSVQVGTDMPASVEINVRGAPATCGRDVFARIEKAEWSCGSQELEVEGKGGPPQGSAQVYDTASGVLLGSTPTSSRGKIELKATVAAAPYQVRVDVSSGTGVWTVGTLLVTGDSGSCVAKAATATQVKKKRRLKRGRKHKKHKRKHKKRKRKGRRARR